MALIPFFTEEAWAEPEIQPKYRYFTPERWSQLRPLIEYLETSSQGVPLTYKHPGGKGAGYGPLGLTRVAYKDVQRLYPEFRNYVFEDILASPELYDLASRAYADALFWNYLKSPEGNLSDIFNLLQRYWFTGPSGGKIPASRQRKAEEWLRRFLQ